MEYLFLSYFVNHFIINYFHAYLFLQSPRIPGIELGEKCAPFRIVLVNWYT